VSPRLVDATNAQSEFSFTDIDGTSVGLWSPGFSTALSASEASLKADLSNNTADELAYAEQMR
jgi:hypothetical protein